MYLIDKINLFPESMKGIEFMQRIHSYRNKNKIDYYVNTIKMNENTLKILNIF